MKAPSMSPSPQLIRTPSSKVKSSPSSYTGDRFIPSRRGMNIELCRRALLTGEKRQRSEDEESSKDNEGDTPQQTPQETPVQKEFKRRMLSSLCDIPLENLNDNAEPTGLFSYSSTKSTVGQTGSSQTKKLIANPYSHDPLRVLNQFEAMEASSTAGGGRSAKDAVHRKIPSAPTRILDAPDLVDDYYLNLISWGPDNILAVALAHCVYLWNAVTGEIHHLTTVEGDDDYVTSVCWCTMPGASKYIAIGTNSNTVQVWDTSTSSKIRTLYGHSGRVSSLAFNQHWLSSGGRDSLILQHDLRSPNHLVSTYRGHDQEVCGLKWNDDGSALASGGNENYLCIWDSAMSASVRGRGSGRRSSFSASPAAEMVPRLVLKQHKAAVKALDWCPFHRGLLATGGGTADRTIKFWNAQSGALLNSFDTGSQVCSLLWSKHQRELVSSHGFSENQLILWKYGSGANIAKVQEFKGHTSRVLSLAASPDGSTVVSAAGDETLRFWDIFGAPRSQRASVLPMGEMNFGMPTIR